MASCQHYFNFSYFGKTLYNIKTLILNYEQILDKEHQMFEIC